MQPQRDGYVPGARSGVEALASRRAKAYTCGMATYTIIQKPNRDGFDVEVIGRNGELRTTAGFETQAAAERWIVIDTRLSRCCDRAVFVCSGDLSFSVERRTRRAIQHVTDCDLPYHTGNSGERRRRIKLRELGS